MKVSNYKTILAGAAAACLFWISAYGKAQASWTTQIEEFGNSSFAGPYETVKIFITSDPGGAGPFQSDGITFETSFRIHPVGQRRLPIRSIPLRLGLRTTVVSISRFCSMVTSTTRLAST